MNVKHYLESKPGYAFMHLQDQFWERIINESLEHTKGNVRKASDMLGISNITFYSWAKKLGIDLKNRSYDVFSDEYKCAVLGALYEGKSIKKAAEILDIGVDKLKYDMDKLGLKSMYFNRLTKREILEAIPRFKHRYLAADFLGVSPGTLKEYMKKLKIEDPWSKK